MELEWKTDIIRGWSWSTLFLGNNTDNFNDGGSSNEKSENQKRTNLKIGRRLLESRKVSATRPKDRERS